MPKLLLGLLGLAAASTPLCPYPVDPNDDVHIDCELETGSYAAPAEAGAAITVVEYNIDRNGFGGDGSREAGMQPMQDLLLNSSLVPAADVLLVSEAGRGCEDYGGSDFSGVEQLAKALQLDYVYAVEFVETAQTNATSECSIGNGLLSRFPIVDAGQLRFNAQCCRYGGRSGGRTSVWADLEVSPGSTVRVHSAHLESGKSSVKSVVLAMAVRAAQAHEITESVAGLDASPVVVGGDMNSPLREIDPTILAFEAGGFEDAHKGLPADERVTCPDSELAPYGLGTDDYELVRGAEVLDRGVCNDEACAGWSDHVPIWSSLSIPLYR